MYDSHVRQSLAIYLSKCARGIFLAKLFSWPWCSVCFCYSLSFLEHKLEAECGDVILESRMLTTEDSRR